jgi:large subunit ribosomal protein L9
MDVILLERVEKLGRMGEVVRVKPGYARNYLLPQKKAVRATEENRKRFEEQRAHLEAVNQERRTQAESQSSGLVGTTVVLIRQAGEAGQLYGSVNARDVAEAVSTVGHQVPRQAVRLSQPIKALGLHRVAIALHPEVVVDVIVNVARSPDEAELQMKTGRAAFTGEAEEAAETDEGERPEPSEADDSSDALPTAAEAEGG